MDDVVYERQRDLHLAPPAETSIVGVGGVGAWVAIDLAMTGAKAINIFDSDVLEVHNLNRLPFTTDDIGKPKVQIVKDFILKMRPDIKVIMNGNATEITKELLRGSIVDCTDRVATQAFLQEYCISNSLPYYRLGYDGHHMTVIDGSHPKAPRIKSVWDNGDGQEGYSTVPSWLVPPQIAAGLVTYMMCTPSRLAPVNMDIREIFDYAATKVDNGPKKK